LCNDPEDEIAAQNSQSCVREVSDRQQRRDALTAWFPSEGDVDLGLYTSLFTPR
jgi:hypothetical protein